MFEEDFEPRKKQHHKTVYAILVLSIISVGLLILLLDSTYGWFGITGNAVTGNVVSDAVQEDSVEGTVGTVVEEAAGDEDASSQKASAAASSEQKSLSAKKKAEALTSSFFDTTSQRASSSSTSVEDTEMQNEISSIKSSIPKTKDLPVSTSLQVLPHVKREVSVKVIELQFATLSTILNVNKDQFALNNLQSPTLKITDFTGTLNLDAAGISLDGVVSKIDVNNVALYSSEDIRLVTGTLDFSKLFIDDIFLNQVAFQSATGVLNVASKLQYTLSQDQLRLYSFKGTLTVDKAQSAPAVFDGVSQGVEVNGDLLRINVQ